MRLYDLPRSPWCQKVRIALAEKGLPHERHIVLPGQEDEGWFSDLDPLGRVPVLVDRDLVVRGARVIAEYLDEAYPDRPLMPESPVDRTRVRMVVDVVDELLGPALEELALAREDEDPDPALLSELRAEVDLGLSLVEDELEAGAPFAVGGAFTLADVALAPFVVGLVDALGLEAAADAHPTLGAYRRRLALRPSVAVVRRARDEWSEMLAGLGG